MFANYIPKAVIQASTAFIVLIGYIALVSLSIPIYLFRLIAIYLAPWLRPDLGPCMSSLSSCFIGDLFTGKAPRSTILLPLTVNGNLTRAELLENVQKKWIEAVEEDGTLKYPQFQYYPCFWLGIPFWKVDPNFKVENHVIIYSMKNYTNEEYGVTEKDLENCAEFLLNAPYIAGRSPWDFHIVENYQNDQYPVSGSDPSTKLKTVILLRIHHSLADGYSLLDALVGTLFDCDMRDLQLPKVRYPNRTLWQKLVYYITIPFLGPKEISLLLKDTFKTCPWKIPDSAKAWHQRYARSELIPIDDVKFIKNVLGVGFTSVLFSVISAGIHKNLEAKKKKGLRLNEDGYMHCLTGLPLPETKASRRIRIKNHITGLIFKIPTGYFPTSVDRLKNCDERIVACRGSVIPFVSMFYMNTMGWLIGNMPYVFGKNRVVSTGLTNFPTKQQPKMVVSISNKEVLFADCVVGGQVGNAGVVFTVISFYPFIRFGITAESAVLTRNELRDLVTYVEDEFQLLLAIARSKGK